MRISYPILMAAAVMCGSIGRMAGPGMDEPSTPPPAFGIPGSAYGSLAARLMRDSLYSYWHAGESARRPAPTRNAATNTSPPPPPAPGRFARRNQKETPPPPSPLPEPPEAPAGSLLDRGTQIIVNLEAARTRREGPLVMSVAHSRYVESAADWRLTLANHLDPGDEVLYEILHHQLQTKAKSPEAAQIATQGLAEKSLARALSSEGGLADALTGAGAAINLLNDRLQPDQTDAAGAAEAWRHLEACLTKFQRVRSEAETEGWWAGIPQIRREELQEHVQYLERLAGRIHGHLTKTGIISQASSR
ncbi:MAG: hypothetical protein ACAI34_02185 [Verrucomicrobium sp.]